MLLSLLRERQPIGQRNAHGPKKNPQDLSPRGLVTLASQYRENLESHALYVFRRPPVNDFFFPPMRLPRPAMRERYAHATTSGSRAPVHPDPCPSPLALSRILRSSLSFVAFLSQVKFFLRLIADSGLLTAFLAGGKSGRGRKEERSTDSDFPKASRRKAKNSRSAPRGRNLKAEITVWRPRAKSWARKSTGRENHERRAVNRRESSGRREPYLRIAAGGSYRQWRR